VPWWTLASLLFFAVVLLGAVVVGALWFFQLRRLQGNAERIAASLEELGEKAEALEERMVRTQDRAEEAERHIARLRRSLDRLSVLTWALGDSRRWIARLRAAGRK
jgi:hypothetical protein